MSDVTRLLDAAAAAELLPVVYEELRGIAAARMAAEPAGHTLDATALVHEAYVRLVAGPGRESGEVRVNSRGHFCAAAAEAMRRILVEAARRKKRLRHGGGLRRQELHPDAVPALTLDPDL